MLDTASRSWGQPRAKGKAKAKGRAAARQQRSDPDVDDADEPLTGVRLTKQLAVEIRVAFVRKVYAILTLQLLTTCAISSPIAWAGRAWCKEHSALLLGACAGMLVIHILMCCFRREMRKFPRNWFYLFLFTACKSIIIGFITAQYTVESVCIAFGVTSAIFAAMTVWAWTTTTDFTGYAPYFAAARWTLFAIGLTLMILHFCGIRIPWLVMLFNVFGVILFTMYIVFDTQRILGEWGGHQYQFSVDDYVFAAMALYIDITRLFVFLLRLLGKRR